MSAASGGNSEPKHDAGTATRHYRAFWQRRCRAAAAEAVLKPLGRELCGVALYTFNFLLPGALPCMELRCGKLKIQRLFLAGMPFFVWVAAAAHFSNVICGIQHPGAGSRPVIASSCSAGLCSTAFCSNSRSTMFRFQAAQASSRIKGPPVRQAPGAGFQFAGHGWRPFLPHSSGIQTSARLCRGRR